MRMAGRIAVSILGLSLLAGCSSNTGPGSGKKKFAFVTNGSSDFWKLAKAGIRKAEKDFDVEVDFQVPGQATSAQQQSIIESLIGTDLDGIAISVLDPVGAISLINRAAERMPVVTQDSDAPDSKRKAYIGTDNVDAGRVAGREILKALKVSSASGGKKVKIALFVGKLDVANARERKQGIEEVLEGTPVEIAETFTDQVDRSKCQEYVRTALDKYSDDLKCLVGLWSYNAPAIVQVVKEKGLAGKIQVVAFDEETPTLDGIEEGIIYSTVVQQPYEFGYKSIEVLSKLAKGVQVDIPKGGLMYVPVKVIDKAGVKEFREKVNTLLKDDIVEKKP